MGERLPLIRSRRRYEIDNRACLTRARVTQIMNLPSLVPDIQEAILFLPPVTSGTDPISERGLREVVAELVWIRQRKRWDEVILKC